MMTEAQLIALRRFAATYGRTWKQALRDAWMNGSYGARSDDAAPLQQLRNASWFGPRGLIKFRLEASGERGKA